MISTKGRYALRMMLDLAQYDEGKPVSLKDIAARQDISKKYLEQIVPLLNHAGMLKTCRGIGGGYMLARPAAEYSVGDILRVTENNLETAPCLRSGKDGCGRTNECMAANVWAGLNRTMFDFVDRISLQDILDGNPTGEKRENVCPV